MRGLRIYIAVGLIVLLGLAALVVWTPRQVSVLIDARSEFVEFEHGQDQESLVFRFVGATVCDDPWPPELDASQVSIDCPGYRALGKDWDGDLVVRGPARVHIERLGQGPVRIVATPIRQPGAQADHAIPMTVKIHADAKIGADEFDAATPVDSPALEGRAIVVLNTQPDRPAHWFATDAARRLQLGAMLLVPPEAGAPVLIEGEVVMRGHSLPRVLWDRLRGHQPKLYKTRVLMNLGQETLRLGDRVRLCADLNCPVDRLAAENASPEAVLRARPHPDGGLTVTARALAAGVEARWGGSGARLIAPSVFDRLHDPVFVWVGLLFTVITSLSLFTRRWRRTLIGKMRYVIQILFGRRFNRMNLRSQTEVPDVNVTEAKQ